MEALNRVDYLFSIAREVRDRRLARERDNWQQRWGYFKKCSMCGARAEEFSLPQCGHGASALIKTGYSDSRPRHCLGCGRSEYHCGAEFPRADGSDDFCYDCLDEADRAVEDET